MHNPTTTTTYLFYINIENKTVLSTNKKSFTNAKSCTKSNTKQKNSNKLKPFKKNKSKQ